MRIKVIYPHKIGHVDASELGRLIQSGEIMAFERERKLVVIGVHSTRKLASRVHPGDRRGRTH